MTSSPVEGGCSCGAVRYRVTGTPLFVHCCHCTWCQRETGSAFALNAMIESSHVETLTGTPETVDTPSASGKGQKIVRCPQCRVAVWSHYGASGTAISFVRVGTLDDQSVMAPDVHIYTSTRRPWVHLGDGAPVFDAFYDPRVTWPTEVMGRYQAARSVES